MIVSAQGVWSRRHWAERSVVRTSEHMLRAMFTVPAASVRAVKADFRIMGLPFCCLLSLCLFRSYFRIIHWFSPSYRG